MLPQIIIGIQKYINPTFYYIVTLDPLGKTSEREGFGASLVVPCLTLICVRLGASSLT